MLTEKQMERYADVLIWGLKTARQKPYRKNDIVLVHFDAPAVRLAEILQGKLLDMGLHPLLRLQPTPAMDVNFYEKANGSQLVFLAPGEKELCRSLNGAISLRAPASLTHLSKVDSRKIGKALVSRKPLRDIVQKREDARAFGWTLCLLPTPELAKHARLSRAQYARQVLRACYLDRRDPVGMWKTIHRDAMAIKKWLNSMRVKHFHVESARVDLRITPGARRKWCGISGHNIPSFEIFLSPDRRGTEGVYYSDLPSFQSGNRVKGVRLTFRKGRAVRVEADEGRTFTEKQLRMDKGAAQVGEFSLTDKRFSRIDRFMASTLYDENYGGRYGNCHLALGSSYTDTYNGNPSKLTKAMKNKLGFNDSALHWDMVNTEKKTVTAYLKNGTRAVIYDNGMFRY